MPCGTLPPNPLNAFADSETSSQSKPSGTVLCNRFRRRNREFSHEMVCFLSLSLEPLVLVPARP
jgi:hypothetical protein